MCAGLAAPAGFYIVLGARDQGVEFWGRADPKRRLDRRPSALRRSRPHSTGDQRRRGQRRCAAGWHDRWHGRSGARRRRQANYPLAIDLCDFECLRSRPFRSRALIVDVQVAAFVEQGECFASDAEFASSAGWPAAAGQRSGHSHWIVRSRRRANLVAAAADARQRTHPGRPAQANPFSGEILLGDQHRHVRRHLRRGRRSQGAQGRARPRQRLLRRLLP